MNGTFIKVSNLTELESLKEDILDLAKAIPPMIGVNGNLMEYLEKAIDDPHYTLVVHVGEGKLNGAALLQFGVDLLGKKVCEIIMAVSKKPHLTKEFMLDLESTCKDMDITRLVMMSEVDSKLYSRWARKFGFSATFTGVTKELT